MNKSLGWLALTVLVGACASEVAINHPRGGATIVAGVNIVNGFTIMAAPKTTADVDHYEYKLYECGPDTVIGGGDDVYKTTGDGDTSTAFTAVPDGKYYITAQAWDDFAETLSISQGGAVASTDTVTIASPTVTYAPADGDLDVTLTLLDGTGESVTNSLTVNNGSAWAGAIGFTP